MKRPISDMPVAIQLPNQFQCGETQIRIFFASSMLNGLDLSFICKFLLCNLIVPPMSPKEKCAFLQLWCDRICTFSPVKTTILSSPLLIFAPKQSRLLCFDKKGRGLEGLAGVNDGPVDRRLLRGPEKACLFGERRSSGASKFLRLRGNARCKACDDETEPAGENQVLFLTPES